MTEPTPSTTQTFADAAQSGGFPPATEQPKPRSPWWLWLITLTLLGVVIVLQRPEAADPKHAEEAAKGLGTIKPPRTGELVIFGKLMLAMKDAAFTAASAGSSPTPPAQQADLSAMLLQFVNQAAGWQPNTQNLFAPALVDKDHPPKESKHPTSAAERVRATILAGEVVKPDELAWRLNDVEKTLAPESPLNDDVRARRVLYGVPGPDGQAPASNQIDPVSRAGLEDRHGWFARLAFTHADQKAPVRTDAAGDGMAILVIGGLAMGTVGLAFLAGIAFWIIALVNSGSMRRAFAPPDPAKEWPADAAVLRDQHGWTVPEPILPQRGGSVWLETVCVFFLGFLALKLTTSAVVKVVGEKDWVIWVPLTLQWALLGVIFWPVVRGMSWERWRGEIGWHKGRGVGREIGAGFAGYMATVPVYLFMAFVVVLLALAISAITGEEPQAPEGNRINDILGGGSIAEMLALALLTTVWAPIVEESIFRGALFKHLRRRMGAVLAALLSATAFAAMHGYAWYGLIIIGTLGFSFALVREWRSSLIPCATAHALHNGFITTLLALVFWFASV